MLSLLKEEGLPDFLAMFVYTVLLASASALHHGLFREPPNRRTLSRRELAAATVGCGCLACGATPAFGFAALTSPSAESLLQYDPPRDLLKDRSFARGMATGMKEYEVAVAPAKDDLFRRMLQALPRATGSSPVIVELGIGSFPNAPYYASASTPLDLLGIDPNDSMKDYALQAARPLIDAGSSVRITHGVGEVLPLADSSVDALVCTLTLCSVPSPERTLSEVRRVLRPGGQFLFLEHVLSESNPRLADLQRVLSPTQVKQADGCHLDRRTLETIRSAGFAKVDARYFELDNFLYLNPTVAGIATA